MESFRKLGIADYILKSIAEEKFEEPSEIQVKSIPPILAGKDVVGESATGSGKTLAFACGIIQTLESSRPNMESSRPQHGHEIRRAENFNTKGVQALVLTPTRELAEQVAMSLRKFSRHKPLSIIAVYGGVSINPQIRSLYSADVVVGTPGRILDHLNRRTINLSNVKILILDEADRMLDMGFLESVEKIVKECPLKRQTLLFSATISREIFHLAHKYMKNPVKVSAESYVDPSKLTQVYYDVQNNLKFSLLAHLLKHEKAGLVMVFCNTRRFVDFVANNLQSSGIDSQAIHGGFSQEKRNRVMQHFHSQKAFVLICTDVAARGLDIKGVSHIYNYDLPADGKDYIHRIGRTARAGKEGKIINLISERDHDTFSRILRDYPVSIKKEAVPQIERISTSQPERERSRFGRGFSQRSGFGQRPRFGERSGFGERSRSGERPRFGRGRGGSRPPRRSFSGRY